MKDHFPKSEALRRLREKAERHLKGRGALLPDAEAEELERLVYELEVHQVELELQNQELKRSMAETETTKEAYLELYDSAPVAYMTLNRQWTIQQANQAVMKLLKRSSQYIIGSSFLLWVYVDDIAACQDVLKKLAAIRKAGPVDIRLRGDAGPVYVQLRGAAAVEPETKRPQFRLALIDISERKRFESRIGYQANLLMLANDAIVGFDADRRVTFWNKAAEYLYGWTREEAVGRTTAEVFQQVETEPDRTDRRDDLNKGLRLRGEWVHHKKDGSPFWAELTIERFVAEGGIDEGFVCVIRDVTDRKAREKERAEHKDNLEKLVAERTASLTQEVDRRRYLSNKLVELLETERRSLSMSLHDEIGQLLAGVNLQMETLKQIQTKDGTYFDEALNPCQEMLGMAIQRLRNINQKLRSEVLDRFGLIPALKALTESLEKHLNIPITLTAKNVPTQLSEDISLALYRIVQESLNNILKYAKAQNVFIHLGARDRSLNLTIEDDGAGFDYDKVSRNAGTPQSSLGLTIMRERAVMAGGNFHIETAPGRGTIIQVEVPAKI